MIGIITLILFGFLFLPHNPSGLKDLCIVKHFEPPINEEVELPPGAKIENTEEGYIIENNGTENIYINTETLVARITKSFEIVDCGKVEKEEK